MSCTSSWGPFHHITDMNEHGIGPAGSESNGNPFPVSLTTLVINITPSKSWCLSSKLRSMKCHDLPKAEAMEIDVPCQCFFSDCVCTQRFKQTFDSVYVLIPSPKKLAIWLNTHLPRKLNRKATRKNETTSMIGRQSFKCW